MWYQRDQFTNNQIPFTDQQLILEQQRLRTTNHPHSEHAKAPGKTTLLGTVVEIGDLVYLHADCNKTRSRDRYLVISVKGVWCNVRKFVGNQLRSTSYRVKRSECYKVTSSSHIVPPLSRGPTSEDDSEDNDTVPAPTPPHPPDIPIKLSTPATPPPVVPLS